MNDLLDVLYLLMLVVFGGLTLYALITTMMQGNLINQDLDEAAQKLADLEERLQSLRQRLRDTQAEDTLLEEEREAYEAQAACMNQLEKSYKRAARQTEDP